MTASPRPEDSRTLDFEDLSNSAQVLVLALRQDRARAVLTHYTEAVSNDPLYLIVHPTPGLPVNLHALSSITEAYRAGWIAAAPMRLHAHTWLLTRPGRSSLPQ